MTTWMAAAVLALSALQEKPAPKEDHEDLTPQKAIELLKEVQNLMTLSEDLLNDSSRGKAMETEEAIRKRIHDLLKDDPAAAQKSALQKIERLMTKSEGSQKDAVERMAEIIRKAKS
jgi:ElaB/YqjD/DUF883 family membrane-anchored ribosome-binding protein